MNEVEMNENEAIRELETSMDLAKMCTQTFDIKREIKGYEMAIKALEEVQQYRAIGGVELCKNAVEICNAMIKRGIGFENVETYIAFEDTCVKKGFTIKGLLEAGEKQTAKRPITYERTNRADCPVCGATVRGISKPFGGWCSYCGQKLDWSDDE